MGRSVLCIPLAGFHLGQIADRRVLLSLAALAFSRGLRWSARRRDVVARAKGSLTRSLTRRCSWRSPFSPAIEWQLRIRRHMKITYKDKTLLESVTFVTLGPGETRLQIDYNNDRLTLILNFISDETTQQRHEYKIISPDTAQMDLVNWNNPLGITFTEPFAVGSIGGKSIFVQMSIKKIGSISTGHEVTFSVYLGEEVARG